MISNWTNMMARRDLLRELVTTELRVSTAQTRLGWLWWLLDPLLMMLIYWVILVKLLGRGSAAYEPYWIFIFFGLVTWKHLTNAAVRASGVLNAKKGLIKSVAFPTMVLPVSSSITAFAFFLFGFAILVVMLIVAPLPGHSGDLLPIVQVPLLMVFQLLLVAAVALPLCCLGAIYRDFNGLVPHLLRLGFYLSPGLFGVDLVQDGLSGKFGEVWGERLYYLYMLNPFAVIIAGYREALFYGTFMAPGWWGVLLVETVLFLWLGYLIYQHYDRRVIKFL
jgi:ABC-type polysaccharide/polyol phosphate export permease